MKRGALAAGIRRVPWPWFVAGAMTACASATVPAAPPPAAPPPALPRLTPPPATTARPVSETQPAPECRDWDQAVVTSNRGDARLAVDVEGAIAEYREALDLCPGEHRITYKLAQAYARKEDWAQMAEALASAIDSAPGFATYHFKLGYALTRLGEAGDTDRFGEALAPLRECIRLDPNHADCEFFLGLACARTLDDQAALEHTTRAIELDPQRAHYYPELAALYLVHQRYDEAERVLSEGTRLIPVSDDTVENVYAMHVLAFQVAQIRDDRPAMLRALERANELAGDRHPELAFSLGATYASAEPPEKEQAIRFLMSFSKRACRGAQAPRFRQECDTAESLMRSLGER